MEDTSAAPALKIAVLGAGSKAAALHVLAYSLGKLGRPTINIVSFDKTAAAAAWVGKHGYSDGTSILDNSPLKDLTFPGSQGEDFELDEQLAKFSWSSYLKYQGTFDKWVDRGCPPCTHMEWGNYLRWALRETEADCRFGTIVKVEPANDKVKVVLKSGISEEFDGFVFTGRGFSHKMNSKQSDRCFNAIDFWKSAHKIKGQVAVVGKGYYTAGAILQKLSSLGKTSKLDLISSDGEMLNRDLTYSTKQVLSNPSEWSKLPEKERKNILSKLENGIVSVSKGEEEALMRSDFSVVRGDIVDVKTPWGKVDLVMTSANENTVRQYDYVVFAAGFDINGAVRDVLAEEFGLSTDDEEVQLDINENLCLPLEKYNIHVPGLSSLAQGPGFSNLSCLNTMAKRIINTYVASLKL